MEAPNNVERENAGSAADEPQSSPATRLVRVELFASVFVAGAVVILVEIMGTRVIGPVFGVSLFVWSALLAVTLGALAIGYYAGGVLVDRTPTQRLLGFVIVTAGMLLALVPLLSVPILRLTDTAGPREGSLIAASLLFGPSLLALGMVGPIAVRLATADVRATGRGVGSVYAISTAGSLLGTFLTSFLLVPAFETDHIFLGSAALLILLGGASLAWHGLPAALGAIVVPILMFALRTVPLLPSGIKVLDRSQSLYGLVEVIEDENRHARFLRTDHSVLGVQFLSDHSSAFSFTHILESVRFLRPNAKEMLQIGLGTGALPSALEPSALKVDIVEIDPAVVRFARDYFGFRTSGEVHEEDARTYLRRTKHRYDLIVHDTFTGGTTPDHLLSLEIFQRLHQLLQSGGVLVVNFAGYHHGGHAEASWAVATTLRSVFPLVRVFLDSDPNAADPNVVGNLAFFASDSALQFTIPKDAKFENELCRSIVHSFQHWEIFPPAGEGAVITDAKNPLARLQVPIAEDHFVAMNKLLPVEVWLH